MHYGKERFGAFFFCDKIEKEVMIMKYIDLTHRFDRNTPVSPFDEKPIFNHTKTRETDSYSDTQIITTMHIGTHIDAPSHMIDSPQNIADFDIHQFIGDVVVLDFVGQKEIVLREADQNKIKENTIVLIYTGMDKIIGTKEYYFVHPQVSLAFANYLVEKKVKLLGLDFFSPDGFPSLVHKKLLTNDILIVENLTNLELLLNKNILKGYFIPLKIDTEGSFIRAFVEVE
jgi:kynurenine formamidase